MDISYTVEVGEEFTPLKRGLAPANYDPDKHDVEFYIYGNDWDEATKPTWSTIWKYRLVNKPIYNYTPCYKQKPIGKPCDKIDPSFVDVVAWIVRKYENGLVTEVTVVKG